MSAGDDRIPSGPADSDSGAGAGAGSPDAWLHAALRHAPDADVAAPPALSAAILREAVAATTGTPVRPAPPSVWQTLLAAWSWLARPPVAAGFASVMLASVIGLMWWDKPLTEALPARVPELAAVSLPPTVPVQDAATPQAAQVAIAPPAVVPEREAPPARAAKAPAAPSAERRRVATGDALGQARPAATANAAVEAPAGVPTDAPAVARSESTKALSDAAPATGVVPPLRESSNFAITAASPAAAPAAPSPAAAAANTSANANAMEASPKLSARPREARLAAAPASLLNEVRAAIRAEPQRWTWQRGAGAERLMTALLQAWLDRVGDAVAVSGPTSASISATTSASSSTPASATELRLFRDGQWHTTLALGSMGLRVTSADIRRTPQQVALSPADAAELKTALDAAATP